MKRRLPAVFLCFCLTAALLSAGAVQAVPLAAAPDGVTSATENPRDTTEETPFGDVKRSDWFYEDVRYAAARGLIDGTDTGIFSPARPLTRSMIAVILWRMENEPILADYDSGFSDLTAMWYIQAVNWARQSDIVTGVAADRFAPNEPLSREQMAVILYRYAKWKEYDVSVGEDTNILSYSDAFDIDSYAVPAVQWACGAGVLRGDGDVLMPRKAISRAEAAALIHRFCESVKE